MITVFSVRHLKATGGVWKSVAGIIVYTLIVTWLYKDHHFYFLAVDPVPVTILGTAMILVLTFRNNSAYDRWWEARKIWGALLNQSRYFNTQVYSMIKDPAVNISSGNIKEREKLILRHIAYVHSLRLQLRNQPCESIAEFLSDEDWQKVKDAENVASSIILLQADNLNDLNKKNILSDLKLIAIEETLRDLLESQGAAERIKKTPFPLLYDFATAVVFWAFIILFPFALIKNFEYAAVIFTAVVGGVLLEVSRIGNIMQDPFHNEANDIPLSSICNTVERELKESMGDRNLPARIEVKDGILM